MALVSAIPIKVDIPHETGAWVEFRKLSWKQIKEARKKQESENRATAKELGAEFVSAMTKGTDDDVQKVRARLKERQWDVDQFDRETLLVKGICAWSYVDDAGKSVDVKEGIDQLDEPTAEWAAEQIIALSRPPSEAEAKNGNAGSTGS